MESENDEPKNDKVDSEDINLEEQPTRKISRRVSVLSSQIDGKQAVSFFGALRIPVIFLMFMIKIDLL